MPCAKLNQGLLLGALAAIGVSFYACTNPEAPPSNVKPRYFVGGCEPMQPSMAPESGFEGPPEGSGLISGEEQNTAECPVQGEDTEVEVTSVNEAQTSSGRPSYSWNGQNFSFDDIVQSPGVGLPRCFDAIDNVEFGKIIDGVIESFQSYGVAIKIADLPPDETGNPRARYNLPSRFAYARSGRYRTYAGTVDVTCAAKQWKYSIWYFWVTVDVVGYRAFNYRGKIYSTWDDGEIHASSGWSYYDSANGYASGSAGGWQDALDTYLETGQCSGEWDIFVDGHQVCKDGQLLNQT